MFAEKHLTSLRQFSRQGADAPCVSVNIVVIKLTAVAVPALLEHLVNKSIYMNFSPLK
jgi:hypothetical protein